MACRSCDVTWVGAVDDECWSCGQTAPSEVARPQVVKVVTHAAS